MSELSRPRIGVVVVTHNRPELLEPVFSALLAEPFAYAVVVDNRSRPEVREALLTRIGPDPRVQVILNDENVFYGLARNQAVELLLERPVDLILAMDNDVVIASGTLRRIAAIFDHAPYLAQVSPVPPPPHFPLDRFEVAGVELCHTINNCTGAISVVRSAFFRAGLRWRHVRWVDQGHIGEDFYFTQDLVRMALSRGWPNEFAWFAPESCHASRNLGRDPGYVADHLDYFLSTFGERGMLRRLRQLVVQAGRPELLERIEAYGASHATPDYHGAVTLDDELGPAEALTPAQQAEHAVAWGQRIDLLRLRLRAVEAGHGSLGELVATRMSLEEVRDYLVRLSVEEDHPFFGQRLLQFVMYTQRRVLELEARIREVAPSSRADPRALDAAGCLGLAGLQGSAETLGETARVASDPAGLIAAVGRVRLRNRTPLWARSMPTTNPGGWGLPEGWKAALQGSPAAVGLDERELARRIEACANLPWAMLGRLVEPRLRAHLGLSPAARVSVSVFGGVLWNPGGPPGDLDLLIIVEDPTHCGVVVGAPHLRLPCPGLRAVLPGGRTLRDEVVDMSVVGRGAILNPHLHGGDLVNIAVWTATGGLCVKGAPLVDEVGHATMLQDVLAGLGFAMKSVIEEGGASAEGWAAVVRALQVCIWLGERYGVEEATVWRQDLISARRGDGDLLDEMHRVGARVRRVGAEVRLWVQTALHHGGGA